MAAKEKIDETVEQVLRSKIEVVTAYRIPGGYELFESLDRALWVAIEDKVREEFWSAELQQRPRRSWWRRIFGRGVE